MTVLQLMRVPEPLKCEVNFTKCILTVSPFWYRKHVYIVSIWRHWLCSAGNNLLPGTYVRDRLPMMPFIWRCASAIHNVCYRMGTYLKANTLTTCMYNSPNRSYIHGPSVGKVSVPDCDRISFTLCLNALFKHNYGDVGLIRQTSPHPPQSIGVTHL